jgi:hypothetical protein
LERVNQERFSQDRSHHSQKNYWQSGKLSNSRPA